MQINEVCIYQVKPKKVEEFELLIEQMKVLFEQQESVLNYKFTKRTHTIENMDAIKSGKPPKKLTRIVKSVKYILYIETVDETAHGEMTKELFNRFEKDTSKCLIMPADKYIGVNL